MKLLETLSSKIANSFVGYLHLGSWLDQRIKTALSGRTVIEFESVESFWIDLFEGRVHDGDRIRFKNAFLTEWVPRVPGAAWHVLGGQPNTGDRRLREHMRLEKIREGQLDFVSETALHYHPHPLGVIRLPFGQDSDTHAVLCLTTVDAWCCDLGVPVLTSAAVYDEFVATQQKGNAVEADMEATVHFGQIPLLDESFMRVLGASVDQDFLRSIVTPLGHPCVFLSVLSPLDAKMRTHNTTPPAFLWSISRKRVTHAVTHHVALSDTGNQAQTKLKAITPHWSYGFLLAPAHVESTESIAECAKGFRLGNISSWLPSETPSIGLGVEKVEVVTEFDARAPRFSTAVPLKPAPWHDAPELKSIAIVLQQLKEAALLQAEDDEDT